MADASIDEDAPLHTLHTQVNEEDNEAGDELQDFRFLSAITGGGKIPKRGEKDFEPHGTRHQQDVLKASRQAMHEALSYTRVHIPKNHVRAWYLGEGVEDDDEEGVDLFSESVRGRGLTEDHVVMVDNDKGTHYKTIGKPTLGLKKAKIWLLPEEAIYLVDRGNLDLCWPTNPLAAIRGEIPDLDMESDMSDGLPLSLQATYALLIGEDGEKGTVSLDTYTVYSNLKRSGYTVLRAPTQDPIVEAVTQQALANASSNAPSDGWSLFSKLFGNLFEAKIIDQSFFGPLVRPGLYRSYKSVYRQLSIISPHIPSLQLQEPQSSTSTPFQVVYHVWKSSRLATFSKSNPGPPDFRVAIVSARSSSVPTLTELTSLLESTPWDPPDSEWVGPGKSYRRLKHGWRNVIIAVVDQGIISYLRMCEAAFGEERLYERFDRGIPRNAKKGGGGKGKRT